MLSHAILGNAACEESRTKNKCNQNKLLLKKKTLKKEVDILSLFQMEREYKVYEGVDSTDRIFVSQGQKKSEEVNRALDTHYRLCPLAPTFLNLLFN